MSDMSDNDEIIRYEKLDDCLIKITMPNNLSKIASALYGICLTFDIAHMCITKEEIETAIDMFNNNQEK